MAGADYRHCDICGCKTFYDANLNYEFGPDIPEDKKCRGEDYSLDSLGDWSVLCTTCAKTHVCVVIEMSEIEAEQLSTT